MHEGIDRYGLHRTIHHLVQLRASQINGCAHCVKMHVRERQQAPLAAFRHAIATGATGRLAALMPEDIELRADGGGKVPALLETLSGKARVLAFIVEKLGVYSKAREWRPADVNGSRGALLLESGRITASVSFAYDGEGRAASVFIVRNPDKLASLSRQGVFLR